MKKQYEKPMAEKVEFNYKETIVASNTPGNLKSGNGDGSCFSGKHGFDGGCTPKYK